METNIDVKIDDIRSKVSDMSDTLHEIDKKVAMQKMAFDDHIKTDELMYQEFKRMNDILQSNTESLKEHMYRTSLLEEIVQKIDARLAPLEIQNIKQNAVREWMKDRAVLAAKIFGAITAIGGLIMMFKPLLLAILNSL